VSALRASSTPDPARLLDVRDLAVSFDTADGVVQAVRGVSFSVERGRTLGIVGESGSGKSVSALTILGLTQGARISGSAQFEGRDLLRMPADQLRAVRGAHIAMIFQDPLSSLHPHYRVGWQIAEMVRVHESVSRRQARSRAVELLGLVGIPRPEQRVDDYPHQFSGGMRQRAMIAMALALNPALLIADEPTTALDVTIQRQILELIRDIVAERRMALILISHDLGVIAQNVQRMLVMYGGSVVESGPTGSVFAHRRHPYTLGLFGARPGLRSARGQRLATIPGTVPELVDLPKGCAFAGRCRWTAPECHAALPPAIEVEDGHRVRCIRLEAVARERDLVDAALTPALSQGEREQQPQAPA
jgi:peptide/nickel transport system ATP-binding protein